MSSDLVLLPGLNNTSEVFADVAAAMPSRIRAYCPDLPALDTVEGLADFVLASAPKQFYLGGFSFGGYVAMAVLDRAPERVLGIALIGSSSKADSEAQAAKRREAIAGAQKGGYEQTASASTTPFHPDSLSNKALIERRRAIVKAYGAERYIAHCRACIARPDRSALLDGSIPTLMVSGSHDVVVPTAGVQTLSQNTPGARFVLIEGAGHLLPLEQPALLAAALTRWIDDN